VLGKWGVMTPFSFEEHESKLLKQILCADVGSAVFAVEPDQHVMIGAKRPHCHEKSPLYPNKIQL